jgi:hypothetical protein
MDKILNVIFDNYKKYKSYLEKSDLVIFILIAIMVLYFLMYIVSFFFKLPVIILFGILVGYYLYKNNDTKVI